jgi:hypothetical protein
MKHFYRISLALLCVVAILLGAGHRFTSKAVHAQQSTQPPYDDGTFYIDSYVDVDDSHNLYVDAYMEVEFDYDEDIDEIELDAYVDQDGSLFDQGYGDGDDYDPVELEADYGSQSPGHEYGLESDGYACFDDGDGEDDFDDCYWEYVGTAYGSVNVQAPPPLISSINPSSVQQGDQGTLTVTGTNFIEYSGDQLTLNFHGGNNPFTLISAPSTCTSSCTATFSYDFSGYPTGTYTLSVSNNEGESDYQSFTVAVAPMSQTFPTDACAVTSSPKVGFTSIVSNAASSNGGTLSISFSGAAFSQVNPTIVYGAFSTPASIASNVAAVVSAKYLQYGISAKAFGPFVIYEGVTSLGAVTHSFTDSSFTTNASSTAASAASMACYALPHIPCLGLWPDYNTKRYYKSDGITETPREHIIRRHISNTASLGPPPTTVYLNTVGASTDQMFSIVQAYNLHTVLSGNPGKGGGLDYKFPTRTIQGVTFGFIGVDGSGNDLQTNHFVLSPDKCSVITSYPIAP